MNKLTDKSLMPFGKYQGKILQEVPANYLLWMLNQLWARQQWPLIIEYIRANKDVLELENEDSGDFHNHH